MNSRKKIPALMLVVIISKLVGMLRDVVLANYYGTTRVSDAYLIACTVPTLLFYFIGHAITTSFLPVYHSARQQGGKERALSFSNKLLTLALLVSAVLTCILLLFPRLIVLIFASGFDSQTAALTAHFIRICSPSIFAMSAVALFTGYLNAHNRFLLPAAVSLPRNAVIMISIVLASRYGLDYMAWGLLAAYFAEVLLLIGPVFSLEFRLRPSFTFKDPDVLDAGRMVLPLMLSLSVSQINKIIDRSIASTIVPGGISALSYASVLNNAVQEVLVTGIITVLFANCSALVAKGETDLVCKKLRDTVHMILFLLIPTSCGVILLSRSMIQVILSRGSFNEASLRMTRGALCFYTIGLPFLAVRDAVIKVFYAYKDTKTTTRTAIAAIIINIILNLILSKYIGINGLAAATSASAIFHCLYLYFALKRKIGDFGGTKTVSVLAKTLFSAGIMTIVIVMLKKPLSVSIHSELLLCAVITAVGVTVYTAVSLLLQNRALYFFKKNED